MNAIDHTYWLLAGAAALVLTGIGSSLIARRFGAPLLLVFLILGMLAGVDGVGGIRFDDYELTYRLGSLALAVILFDGGLRTRREAFRVSDKFGQAMAWENIHLDGVEIVDKPGGLNNASAYIGLVPARGIGIVLLANRGNFPHENARYQVLPALAR